MQAIATLRGQGFSRGLAAILIALAATLLVVGAAIYAGRSSTGSGAAVPSGGVVTAVGAPDRGSAWNYGSRRSGTQSVDGPAPTPDGNSQFREPRSRAGGSQI